jgi:hypothetical protein
MAVNENLFPLLAATGYRITSPVDSRYNCIAWAAGQSFPWWWPDPDGFDYWPPNVPREHNIAAFVQAFGTLGYEICQDGALELGWEKVAIYAIAGAPMHAARQLPNGLWTSKLGPDEDIEHELNGLSGTAYGTVIQILRRPAAKKLTSDSPP